MAAHRIIYQGGTSKGYNVVCKCGAHLHIKPQPALQREMAITKWRRTHAEVPVYVKMDQTTCPCVACTKSAIT